MKLSQMLKYVGLGIGGIAGIKIVWLLFALILTHKVVLVILAIGVLTYFIGVWLKKKGK